MKILAERLYAGAEALRNMGMSEEADRVMAGAEDMLVEAEKWATEVYANLLAYADSAIRAYDTVVVNRPVRNGYDVWAESARARIDNYYRDGIV